MSDEKSPKVSQRSREILLGTLLLTGSIFGSRAFYRRYLKQYKTALDIPKNVLKKRWLYGKITAVGDGDNVRLFHTPGGIFGGWGTLRSIPELARNKDTPGNNNTSPNNSSFISNIFSRKPSKAKKLSQYYMGLQPTYKGKRNLPTISIRLSGIDAPERAHFGGKTQPFGDEAMNWLRYCVLGKRVWAKPLSIDQYNRCVARVVYWSWTSGWTDISLQMLKEGLAVVYEAKTGAQFDGQERLYRRNEQLARQKSRGLWAQKKVQTPGQYKKNQQS